MWKNVSKLSEIWSGMFIPDLEIFSSRIQRSKSTGSGSATLTSTVGKWFFHEQNRCLILLQGSQQKLNRFLRNIGIYRIASELSFFLLLEHRQSIKLKPFVLAEERYISTRYRTIWVLMMCAGTTYRYMKVAILGSRDQLCVNPAVMQAPSSREKLNMCQEFVKMPRFRYQLTKCHKLKEWGF